MVRPTKGGGRGRTVIVAPSGRGAAGVKVTLSERFEGNSRAPSTSAPRSVGRGPARADGGQGRTGRSVLVANSRDRVRGAIRKGASAPTVVRGGRPASGVAPGRVGARAAGRNAARNAGHDTGRDTGRNAGRNAGRGRGRDESRDESLTLADMDADMDAWKGERTTQQEAILAPVEGTAEGDAAPGAADTGGGAADEGDGAADEGGGADAMETESQLIRV